MAGVGFCFRIYALIQRRRRPDRPAPAKTGDQIDSGVGGAHVRTAAARLAVRTMCRQAGTPAVRSSTETKQHKRRALLCGIHKERFVLVQED